MKRLFSYLKQPYPVLENKWTTILTISIFVSLFLLIFKPFGSGGITLKHRNLIMAGYGCVTFIVLVFNLIVLPYLFKNQFIEIYWTIGKQFIWLAWIIFSIGLGNYFYSYLFFSISGSFIQGLLWAQLGTFLVGFFPISVFSLISYTRLLNKNLMQARTLNTHLMDNRTSNSPVRSLVLSSENEKNTLKINDQQLLYISSEGNYSTIFYEIEGEQKKMILRTTLSRLENQLSDIQNIIRCHRAFIINVVHIQKIGGNSQGLRLKIKSGVEVPVSRNYIKQVKDRVQHL